MWLAVHSEEARALDLASPLSCEMNQEEQEAWPAKVRREEPVSTPRISVTGALRKLALPS